MADLQQAITAIKSGDKTTGKQLLIEIIKANPNNETAWLWMTNVVSTDAERLKCLQNVLKINPDSEQAKRGLAALQQRQVSQPAPKIKSPPKEPPPKLVESQPKLIEESSKPVPQANRLQPIDLSQLTERLQEERPPKPALIPSQSQSLNLAEHRAELQQGQVPPPRPLKPLKKEATKKCPYCAETIKAEAKFCRFCGRDLTPGAQSSQLIDDSAQIIDDFIAEKSRQGWQVISRTHNSVQIRRPKQWSKTLLAIGLVGLLLFGAGLIFLILAAIDYVLFQKEEIIHVTADQIRDKDIPKDARKSLQIAIVGGCILACALCWAASRVGSSSQAPRAVAPTGTPTTTPPLKFSDEPYFSIEDLLHGVLGNSRLLDYRLDTTSWAINRRTGYDLDIWIKSPETRTRKEMLQMIYVLAHEFYYNFSNREPGYLTLHLRASENDSLCVFGLGIGYSSAPKYLPPNQSEDLEKWFNDLVTSKYYGDLPGESDEFLAYGNDPANVPLCKLEDWKR